VVADIRRKRLSNLQQWSEHSDGYPTFQDLLDSCIFCDDGKVTNPVSVTELTAHAWVAAAEIYLHCRFYR
jgi:hypothetical protein